jgi:hypothetical protein
MAKRKHSRGFATVVCANKQGRLFAEIYPHGFQLSEVLDLNKSDSH